MRERKYVKFRVDMHEDTKFKIIDRMPERDLVHYVWTRFVALAAKVNREGDLYLSKNIPYIIETLAIEFNRGIDQIKLAVDVFMQLEMIEFTEHNVYRVKNFAKHQNIKVKEKIEPVAKEEDVKNKEIQVKEILENEKYVAEDKKSEIRKGQNEDYEEEDVKSVNLEIVCKGNDEINTNMRNEKISSNSQDNVPILVEMKKNNNVKRNKKKDTSFEVTDEETKENPMFRFWEGDERPLGENERVLMELAF